MVGGVTLNGPQTQFERLLTHVERKLRIELDQARETTDHAGDKGSIVESHLRKALRKCLPSNMTVGHGKVYDSYGDRSRQIDVVIANADQPFSFDTDEPVAYVLEGVSAVGEVKSVFGTKELADSVAKATEFKKLRQTFWFESPNAPVHKKDVCTNLTDGFVGETMGLPPFFVIAFESSVSVENLVKELNALPLVSPPDGKVPPGGPSDVAQHALDGICLLDKGVVVWNFRSGIGPVSGDLQDGRKATGWIAVNTPAPFACTLSWLQNSMPRYQRASSVLDWYMNPRPTQLAYMAKQAGPK